MLGDCSSDAHLISSHHGLLLGSLLLGRLLVFLEFDVVFNRDKTESFAFFLPTKKGISHDQKVEFDLL